MKNQKNPLVQKLNKKQKTALNIENFINNHIGDEATGRQQNMAARRDSWIPIDMKNNTGTRPSV